MGQFGDLEIELPSRPGQGWARFCIGLDLIGVTGIPLVAVGGTLAGHPWHWAYWIFFPLWWLGAWRDLLTELSRWAQDPTRFKVRGGYVRIEPRGNRWSFWAPSSDTVVLADEAEIQWREGKLLLWDRRARTASIQLAEGREVRGVVDQFRAAGFEVKGPA